MQQLKMKWVGDKLYKTPLNQGIVIRNFNEGDADLLIDALTPLTEKRLSLEELDKVILKHEGVYTDGIFLAEINGEVIGTTTGHFEKEPNPNIGVIHMVSVHPKARGRKVGRILCEYAMEYLIDNGCSEIYLTTDDHRLAAIKTYINLGFRPVLWDEDMKERWSRVLDTLSIIKIDAFSKDKISIVDEMIYGKEEYR